MPGRAGTRAWLVDREFGDHRSALAGVLQSLLLTRHVLFVGTSTLDDDLIGSPTRCAT